MMSRKLRCRAVKIVAYGCTTSNRGCPCFPSPPGLKSGDRVSILCKISFEAGLTGWS